MISCKTGRVPGKTYSQASSWGCKGFTWTYWARQPEAVPPAECMVLRWEAGKLTGALEAVFNLASVVELTP